MSLRCSICRKTRRRGSSSRVAILSDGMVANGIACASCSARAVLVAVPPAEAAEQPDDVREVLTAIARTFRGRAKLAMAMEKDEEQDLWNQAADLVADRAKNPGTRRLGS